MTASTDQKETREQRKERAIREAAELLARIRIKRSA